MVITHAPVVVTGVTGYVGAEVARQLLDRGYKVRGTTRNIDKARKDGFVTALEGAEARLELVEADLLVEGSFDAALVGSEYVMHVASPYFLEAGDPQRDLVDPAVNGTLGVLRAALATPTVKRVVLTSSIAASLGRPKPHAITEADWNEASNLESGPYAYSKRLAEEAAWAFMEKHTPHFDLVAINPSAVIGPSVVPRFNTSSLLLAALTNGTTPGIVDLPFAYVDIRDTGRAHVAAMETASASGRYLCHAATVTMRQVVDVMEDMGLRDRFKIPKLALDNRIGNGVARFAALFQPKQTRRFVQDYLGKTISVDTSKIRRELGMTFRPIDETLRSAIADVEKWGHLGQMVAPGDE